MPLEKEEYISLRSDKVMHQVHAFMNVSAVLAIFGFVALHRNKSIDLAGMLIKEQALRQTFDVLC